MWGDNWLGISIDADMPWGLFCFPRASGTLIDLISMADQPSSAAKKLEKKGGSIVKIFRNLIKRPKSINDSASQSNSIDVAVGQGVLQLSFVFASERWILFSFRRGRSRNQLYLSNPGLKLERKYKRPSWSGFAVYANGYKEAAGLRRYQSS